MSLLLHNLHFWDLCVTFILHVYDLTLLSGAGGGGGRVTGKMAAKPLTTVQDLAQHL